MPVPPIIPTFRYRDAPAAIDFLVGAFGFERNMVVDGPGETIAHAQLTFAGGMVMLGSAGAGDGEFPLEPGGGSTYVILDDVDGHCDRARAAGAEIVMEPADQDYGGRSYTARDPDGNLWSFGSYRPSAG